jgi:hypothetical protein
MNKPFWETVRNVLSVLCLVLFVALCLALVIEGPGAPEPLQPYYVEVTSPSGDTLTWNILSPNRPRIILSNGCMTLDDSWDSTDYWWEGNILVPEGWGLVIEKGHR